MRLGHTSRKTVTTVRRVLAGGAIAAVAVFGAAACEDEGDNGDIEEPAVENPDMEGEEE
ncbi:MULTISPECIES: hypothetical protein [Nocardiopsis]|uniref:Uncharacterized protein n=1 Tax=Nocardiopsis sinuspersici TaxID=501010 RepID=A0A7Z0BMJ1_9ACTN|nr:MULTISPECIES: hypothetical protein [Nocardiopsis]NYH54632.1 hypothetical protein [Nocardiopsis sinuspersici]